MKRRQKQSGYSLLMVVFLVATVLIFSTVVTPNLLTEGRRERETETIWRGEQYEHAIGLYYRKFGKYPTKIEDLTKQTNGVRFLRKAYTDPMNKDDGSWRFIYVGPNGQLIGSLRQTSLLQGVMSTAALPGSTGASSLTTGLGALLGSGSASSPGAGPGVGLSNGSQPGGASGTQPGGAPGTTTPGVGQTGLQGGSAMAPDALESQPQPLDGALIGGNIIGVGSKIKEPSIQVYLGGPTYQLWEFIWNPNQQVAIPGQNSVNPVAPPAPATGQATGLTPTTTPQVPAVNAPATPSAPPPTQ